MKKNKIAIILVLSFVILILLVVIIYLTFNKREKSAEDEKSSFEASIESKSDNTDEEIFILEIPANKSKPDFTDVKILSKADLNAMNPDEPVDYGYNHLNKIRSVQGVCAEFKINNSDDALKAIYALQNIITVCDINNLRLEDEFHDKYTDRYEFKQYVYGIESLDGGVAVRVDTDTKEAFSVASNIHYNADIEPTYKISNNEVKEIVKNNEKFTTNKITHMELVIYQYTLAWYVETDNFEHPGLFIDANTGEILYIDQIEEIS